MTTRSSKASGEPALAQSEIVVVAAYLLGAGSKRIDTEDIAVKAHEIAPGIFTWKKYRDQIDRELVYKHLWDLTKADKGGGLVTGAKNEGWMLTLAGTTFAESAVQKLKGLSPAAKKKREEPWVPRERARMRGEMALTKMRDGRVEQLSIAEAERFFRLDGYVVGEARERKIRQAENTFHDDPEIGPFLSRIAEIARSKR